MHATSITIERVASLAPARPVARPFGTRARRRDWLRRARTAFVIAGWVTLASVLVAKDVDRRYAVGALPDVAAVDIERVFFDRRPVQLTITAAWVKVPHVATRDEVHSDVTLWRRMHVDDWDSVPSGLRGEAFDNMLAMFGDVLSNPATWDRMRPVDWDDVPQPIRVMAFRHMAEYWSGYYQVGARHDIPRGTMANVLSALLMSESWFEHRAVNVNRWGNRDLGLAQASDATRDRMVALHRAGVVDVLLEPEDYFDPWKATRFIALWMNLLLDEVHGDLELAMAAYHRGSARAHDRRGQEYLEAVRRRLHRFIRNENAPAAWDDLWRRDAVVSASTRPWLSTDAGRFAVATATAAQQWPGRPVDKPAPHDARGGAE